MKKSYLIGTEGEVLVADGQSVRVVTATHVITVVGGDGARVSVEPFRGGARVAGCKPLTGLARVRVAYDVLSAFGYVSGYGSQSAFIRAAVRRGWWASRAVGSRCSFSDVVQRVRFVEGQWRGDAAGVELARAFGRLLR